MSLVDFNRAGAPLVEIVSKPDMRSPAEVAGYAEELRRIMLYIGGCCLCLCCGNGLCCFGVVPSTYSICAAG